MFDTFCPLRGDACNDQCEWMSDDGICMAHHIATSMERIAEALEKIVSGPAWEDDAM